MQTLQLNGVTTKERTSEIMTILEKGVRDVFESEHFRRYLSIMARFHRYSYRNTLLIMLQMPEAERVCGISQWNRMDRQVIKGSKAIRILAPATYQKEVWEDALNAFGKPVVNPDNGKNIQILRKTEVRTFKPVSVFDVSQTTGDPLPELATELKGSFGDSEKLMEAIRSISPCPISIRSIKGKAGAKGFFSPAKNEIVIKSGMSPVHTVKTAIHEICHARLHDPKNQPSSGSQPTDRHTVEVEAESVAFVVCQHFSIDTSDYSFGYLATWSSSAELTELQHSLATIQHEANQIIEELSKALQPLPVGVSDDEKEGDDLAS